MTRVLLALLLLILLPSAPAHAQQKVAPAPAQQKAAPAPTISAEEARAALDVLNDPKKREAFAATLQAIVKAQPQPAETAATPAAEAEPEPAVLPLAPDSLGAQLLLGGVAFVKKVGESLADGFQTMQSLPLAWGWIVVLFTRPIGQKVLIEAASGLGTALVLALAAWMALRRLIQRPLAHVTDMALALDRADAGALEQEDPQALAELGAIEPRPRLPGAPAVPRRMALGLAWFGLKLVPTLGLLVVGYVVAASMPDNSGDTKLVILAVINAIAACQALLTLLSLLISPDTPSFKQLGIRVEDAEWVMRWGRRLILIAVPGYAFAEVALLLGLSRSAHGWLEKLIGFLLAVCLAVMVVQSRRKVRRWLSAPAGADGLLNRTRNWLARHWYWGALFFLAATWVTWAWDTPFAIRQSLWYFGVTTAVLAAASVVRRVVERMIDHLAVLDDGTHSVPSRISAYRIGIRRLAGLFINLAAALILAQVYGLNVLTWLTSSEPGRTLASGFGSIAVTIGLALAVWEGVNIAILTHLDTLRREARAASSARLLTLLPLLRTTLGIAVVVIAGLMVLSEIGVNIAPLLAGAGIAGVAIGFGSQRLVQDVITGVFLLLENTMQVGDVVRVGDQTGTVESLSVRTIRLRTDDGSVVVIPFSAVTTVVNMTRDFSQSVIAVDVAPTEDVDRVSGVMREIVAEMRSEPAWSGLILADFELYGVDKVSETAVSIKGRIKCTPFGRWAVGREFNRRMQNRFRSMGVSMPVSSMRLVLDEPGRAPAANTERLQDLSVSR